MRVHELAKELELHGKSQELFELCDRWGIQIKRNPLTNLDEQVIREIRNRYAGKAPEIAPKAPEPPRSGPHSPPPPKSPDASPPKASSPSPPETRPGPMSDSATVAEPTAAVAIASTPPDRSVRSEDVPVQPVTPPPNGSAPPPSTDAPEPVATHPPAATATPDQSEISLPSETPRTNGSADPAIGSASDSPAPDKVEPPVAPTAVAESHAQTQTTDRTTASAETQKTSASDVSGPEASSSKPQSNPSTRESTKPDGNSGPHTASRPRESAGPLTGFTTRQGRHADQGGDGPRRGNAQHEGRPPRTNDGDREPKRPLTPDDYVSPAGTRNGGGVVRNLNQPRRNQNQDRERGEQGPRSGRDSEQNRRGGGGGGNSRRPVPSVAPTTPPPLSRDRTRRDRDRDSGPSRESVNTEGTGLVKQLTKEQMLEMMRRKNIGPKAGGSGPAAKTPHEGTRRPSGAPSSPVPPVPPQDGSAPPRDQRRRPMRDGVQGGEDDADSRNKAGGAKGPGSPTRQDRRNRRGSRAPLLQGGGTTRDVLDVAEDDSPSRNRRQRGQRKRSQAIIAPRKTKAQITPPINVRSLSEETGIAAKDLLKKLWSTIEGMTFVNTNINSNLDEEVAQMIAMDFGVELEIVHEQTADLAIDQLIEQSMAGPDGEDAESTDLEPRPPVITILGHVDHGKTSLLDRIRKANVVDSESGGITQHIGAYQIEHSGHRITFVDTPGHEAFTAMRARGANVTDIVVLVVAADDGVMPQTEEAISHAKAADRPIIVALNKIDLPGVNLERVYTQLSQQGLQPEEWGGDTQLVKTSAVTGEGIDELLDSIMLIAELLELKADPNQSAVGTCLEAKLSEGRGVVSTLLVQHGTLRVGDSVVCGNAFGRVRALYNDRGQSVDAVGPSTPVEVSGLDEVPTAGEKFAVANDVSQAREVAEIRRSNTRGAELSERSAVTLENLYTLVSDQKVKTLNLILKADVQGSMEALLKELDKLANDEVPIKVLHKGVGGITESDILLADASEAIVIGFRAVPEDRALSLAEEKEIEIRHYDIIYQVTDEIKQAVEGMLTPEVRETHLGRASIRQVFRISKVGNVAGCIVLKGNIERTAKVRLIRDGTVIYKGEIEQLKRYKDDAKDVREGQECGIKIGNYNDVKEGDTIEAFREEIIKRTL